MAYRTFGDLREQVEAELDLEAEEFIQPTEMQRYFNSGIQIIEAEIIKLGLRERYLQDEAFISIVVDQQDYSLPADIIDTKIRKLVYRENTIVYTIKPLRSESAYETEDVFNLYNSSDYYFYSIYKTSENYVLRLTPKARKNFTDAIRIIYFKDLNQYTDDDTNCDVPQICYEYLLSYVRYRCYKKELHANADSEKQDLAALLQLMRETLQGQVADPDMDLNDQDVKVYEEHS